MTSSSSRQSTTDDQTDSGVESPIIRDTPPTAFDGVGCCGSSSISSGGDFVGDDRPTPHRQHFVYSVGVAGGSGGVAGEKIEQTMSTIGGSAASKSCRRSDSSAAVTSAADRPLSAPGAVTAARRAAKDAVDAGAVSATGSRHAAAAATRATSQSR